MPSDSDEDESSMIDSNSNSSAATVLMDNVLEVAVAAVVPICSPFSNKFGARMGKDAETASSPIDLKPEHKKSSRFRTQGASQYRQHTQGASVTPRLASYDGYLL